MNFKLRALAIKAAQRTRARSLARLFALINKSPCAHCLRVCVCAVAVGGAPSAANMFIIRNALGIVSAGDIARSRKFGPTAVAAAVQWRRF